MQRSARQSIFPQQAPPDAFWSSLDACSQALHATSTSLSSAITTLQQGTYDFPRLAGVVSNRRCFEVVTESEISRAQRELADDIEPQIKELIDRAELGLGELKARQKTLRTRVDKRAAMVVTASRPPLITSTSDSAARKARMGRLRVQKLELTQAGSQLDAEISRLKKSLSSAVQR